MRSSSTEAAHGDVDTDIRSAERAGPMVAPHAAQILALQRAAGNRAVARMLRPVGPRVLARYTRQWENPALRETIYGARETMLRRFIAMHREIELGEMPQERRTAVIEDLKRVLDARITELSQAPAGENRNQQRQREGRLRDLRRQREALDGRNAWQTAVGYEREHYGENLSGDALMRELERMFNATNVPQWVRQITLDYGGMRYASSHGSFFSPQRLLYIVEDEAGTIGRERTEAAAEARREAEAAGRRYRAPRTAPRTATETRMLGMTPAQANAELERRRTAGEIPDWAWHEVVRQTELRVQHARAGWDAAQTAPRGSTDPRDALWTRILSRWRGSERVGGTPIGITGWRAEMQSRNALVVIRAVCNELAEASARARGISLRGGISNNSEDFFNAGQAAAAETPRPEIAGSYFRNPTTGDDLRPGANIFFVKGAWNDGEPRDPSNKVRYHAGLRYPNPAGGGSEATAELPENGQHDGWTYHLVEGDSIRRSKPGQADQWMTWSHQATVERVVGNFAFMIETTGASLDDQTTRGGFSGFSRRALSTLLNRPGVFVGYMPERTTAGGAPGAQVPAAAPVPAAPPAQPAQPPAPVQRPAPQPVPVPAASNGGGTTAEDVIRAGARALGGVVLGPLGWIVAETLARSERRPGDRRSTE